MKFNINEYVKIKLNDNGIDILRKRHNELRLRVPSIGDFVEPVKDDDGYSSFPLWALFDTFGEYVHLGCIPPFDTTIIIPERK